MPETEKRPPRLRDVLGVLAVYGAAALLNIIGFSAAVVFPFAIARFFWEGQGPDFELSSRQLLGAFTVMLGPVFLIAAGRNLVRELRRQLRAEAPVPPHV